MALAKEPKKVQERDWVQEIEESKAILSMSMQYYVNKMGSKNEFTAAELAGVLGMTQTGRIYELVDSGAIGCINRGSRERRYCVFPRPCVLKYLQEHCNQG